MKLQCKQTVLLREKRDGGLENLLRITISDLAKGQAALYVDGQEIQTAAKSEGLLAEYWIDEPQAEQRIEVTAVCDGECVREAVLLRVPRHWELHMVQYSHHDPGYTDLMSHVFERHYEWLDQVLDDMDARQDYPEDTRYRIAIEQFWSLDYYLQHAPKERAEKLVDYIKKGDIELTALYANLTTEQLGHEECYRALYAAQAFAEKCGVRITAATHNDVPGVSWGLCRALCDAGIEFFVPDFPTYYNWGYENLISFWEPKKAFGHEGPGACYWKSPDGKRILMWSGGEYMTDHWDASWIEDTLEQLEGSDYPYAVLRAAVKGATVDNSCFSPAYPDHAKKWNETYAYPHIIMSTNQQFRDALVLHGKKCGFEIPEISGEMPGQDYPAASMSMAQITSAARRTHGAAVAAEKLLTLVSEDQVVYDQTHLIQETYRDLLLADDHAYGYQFSAGPAMRASYWEKGVYAMRSEANVQDLMDKAISSIADRIAPMDTDLRLLVFNASTVAGKRAVQTPMREFDNCGTIIRESNQDSHVLKGYLLNNRRRVNPEPCFWKEGRFKLVDLESGKDIPYYIDDLQWDDPVHYAPESAGLGSGTNRYGFFENPGGMKRILRFVAEDLPAFGYRCYGLVPTDKARGVSKPAAVKALNNGIYRIETDEEGICSVFDLRKGREVLDPACPHRLGDLLVRNGRNPHAEKMRITRVEVKQNEVFGIIDLYGKIDGAHDVRVRLTAWQGVESLDLSVRMLHNAKPLQSMFLAFPFAGKGFRYEGMLSELEPAKYLVPGGQSDFLTICDYVAVKESGVLFSSRDTGVVALSHLWPGYISPAHSCVMEYEIHNPLKADAFDTGWIYALLTMNNFGTNFMCSQTFDGVYGFSFACSDRADDASRALWGEREQTPVVTQFTDRSRGTLPPAASLLDTGDLHCLVLKKAEDKRGYIARLWNHSEKEVQIRLRVNGTEITEYSICDALERSIQGEHKKTIAPGSVITIRF